MESISLPSKVQTEKVGEHETHFTIEPCFPGYGTTLGNALRRVLLSSMPGSAASAVKIKGTSHEFSTIPNVKEDIVELLLNFKNLRLKLESDEPALVILKAKGERDVTAKDLKAPSNVTVVNPSQHLATLTDKAAELDVELTVTRGRGYVPVEMREKEKLELGTIALDAIYTPVRNVNYDIENVRVGQMTNYDRLKLSIRTDGTVTPEEAFQQAAMILVEHFSFLQSSVFAPAKSEEKKSKKKKGEGEEATKAEKTEASDAEKEKKE